MEENRIGELIKKYRCMKSLTQAQLAEKLEIAPSALAAYESGTRKPKVELRIQIARVLEVDPVALSGIELTEVEEKRLLNKLIYKYCIRTDPDEDLNVDVKFNDDLLQLSELVQEYLTEIDVQLCLGSERDNLDSILESTKENDEFWLETWPQYDYVYKAKLLGLTKENYSMQLRDMVETDEAQAYERYNEMYLKHNRNEFYKKAMLGLRREN